MSILNNDVFVRLAREEGFNLVGFSPAEKLHPEAEYLREWLERNLHSGMTYMEKNLSKRTSVDEILPSVKTVISLGMNYYKEGNFSDDPRRGKISRYAWGKDYHLVIWKKLDDLLGKLHEIDPLFEAVSYVDTGPVMDKAWAVRAGLGWLGKHTNVINKETGSWFFIATILTNLNFTPSVKVDDFCGDCRECLDACPTGALEEYILDSNRCISYLTIENKEEIPEEFKDNFKGWIFGCDICQEVCPWNRKFASDSGIFEFRPVNKELDISEAEMMEQDEFSERFGESPLKRIKLKGLKRNAAFLRNKNIV